MDVLYTRGCMMLYDQGNKQIWRISFLFCYILYAYKTVIVNTVIDPNTGDFLKVTLTLLLFMVFALVFLIINKKEKIFLLILLLYAVVNYAIYKTTATYPVLIMCFFVFMAKRIPIQKIINDVFISNIVVIFISLPLFVFIDQYYIADPVYGERLTLGFVSPNTISILITSLFFSFNLFVSTKTRDPMHKVLWVIISCILCMLVIYETKSRTSGLILFLGFLGFIYASFSKEHRDTKNYSLFAVYVLIIICVQLLSVFFFRDKAWLIPLNYLLSGRVFLGNVMFEGIGYPSFVHGIDITNYLPIDFFYLYLFYSCGVIYSIALIVIVYYSIRKRVLSKTIYISIFCYSMFTITESQFLIPLYNLSILLIYACPIKNKLD